MALKFVTPNRVTGTFATDLGSMGTVIYERYTARDGQTDFTLQAGYIPGSHQLNVYRNGVLQLVDLDYREISPTQIQFTTPLLDGDVILLSVQGIYTERLHFETTSLPGQTVFHLASPYHPGMSTLLVFVNGLLQRVGVDYLETDPTTVTFLQPLYGGELVTFHEQLA